ncbi:cpw-wpc domain-containing protein [Besnoitia besnoiti]|uniref:Cpw-wpc domain-containing protein n=1 Tax=Besnoitia besnoiti TaxID=94643 RepID=A0A2A9MLZ4_BESBE|nr:cpw-wpc domain-containing protein [Besnoitia besnoiti]PFH36773.1 cpw-wpc domain-containing protein [Besnoitia besnoiti]
MKWVCAVTFVLSVAQATALHWPGSGQQPLSFSFPTPEPGPAEHELIEPQKPRISTEATEAMKDTKANLAEEELETAADEATGKLQEALMVAEPPQGPGEEKETRVREKGGFLSNIMQKAAEAFSSSGLTQLYGGEQVRQFQKAVIRALEEVWEDFDKLMQEPAAECPRDYSLQCPETFRFDGATCVALEGYIGPCAKIQRDLPKLTEEQKAAWSTMCQASFPCLLNRGQCPRDFSSRCPIGWIDLGDGRNCQAPESYIGNCDRVLYFGEMTNSQKLEKMAACAVEWPCVGEWTRGATPIRVQLEKQEILPTYTAQPDGAVSDRGIVQTRLI